MSSPKETYTKKISPAYTRIPDEVHFHDKVFDVQKTWKIGVKRECDMNRQQFIKEMENVNMFDVNQYKVAPLKSQV